MKRLFITLFMSLFIPLAGLRVETFHGLELTPYLPQILELCNDIYKEYPYPYNRKHSGNQAYLESYPHNARNNVERIRQALHDREQQDDDD